MFYYVQHGASGHRSFTLHHDIFRFRAFAAGDFLRTGGVFVSKARERKHEALKNPCLDVENASLLHLEKHFSDETNTMQFSQCWNGFVGDKSCNGCVWEWPKRHWHNRRGSSECFKLTNYDWFQCSSRIPVFVDTHIFFHRGDIYIYCI